MVILTNDLCSKMAMGRVLKNNNEEPINSIDFSKDGDWLVSASDDGVINLVSCVSGTLERQVFSKNYGVDLIRFTHAENTVICASKNNNDHTLRYLSLHDNRYLRYFKGHRDTVLSLSMNSKDDSFISSSADETVRLWDLRTNVCQAKLNLRSSRPIAAFEPEGVAFGVISSGTNTIRLFDVRNSDKGPFQTIKIEGPAAEFSGLKFSPNGAHLLATTKENCIYLLDAFEGAKIAEYTDFLNDNSLSLEASFSPDSHYVCSGSEDGSIIVWEAATANRVATWSGHAGPVRCVQWNPKHAMVASACTNLALWIPKEDS